MPLTGLLSHHPASVPGRMDVSMWTRSVCKGADSQTAPEWPSPAPCRSTCCSFLSGSAQSGWFYPESVCVCRCDGLGRWNRKVEGERKRDAALLCWYILDSHQHTQRKRKVTCTEQRKVFFDVRIIFKMSLCSSEAKSASKEDWTFKKMSDSQQFSRLVPQTSKSCK